MAEEVDKKEKDCQNKYSCSKCGASAAIKDNLVVRTCNHENESVIANISSVCHAHASCK